MATFNLPSRTTQINTFFSGVDSLPWCNSNNVFKWECKLLAASSDEQINVILHRLLWALVHSMRLDDVECGITMLQGSLLSPPNLKQKKKDMYLLAVGYYRKGDYSTSMDLVDACLEIAPDSCSAIILKNLLEDRIMRDGVNGKCIAASMSVRFGPGFVRATTFKNLIKDCAEKDISNSNPLQMKEEMFLLAHRYYVRGDYSRSRYLVDYCLEKSPKWRRAIALKKSIKYYEIISVGVGGIALGGVVAAVLSLKRH